jgi:hypothetical protein
VLALSPGAVGDADPTDPELAPGRAGLPDLLNRRVELDSALRLVERVGNAVGAAIFRAIEDGASRQGRALVVVDARLAEPTSSAQPVEGNERTATIPALGAQVGGGSELGRSALSPCHPEGDVHTNRLKSDPHWPKRWALLLHAEAAREMRYLSTTRPIRSVRLALAADDHVQHLLYFGLPGEPTSYLAHRLERDAVVQYGVEEAAVVGLCGEYHGYWTTRAEHDAQHYEGASMLWGRHAGEWLVQRAVALPKGSPEPLAADTNFVTRVHKHWRLQSREVFGPMAPRIEVRAAIGRQGACLRVTWHGSGPVRPTAVSDGPWVAFEEEETSGRVVPLRHDARPVNDQTQLMLVRYTSLPDWLVWTADLFIEAWLAGKKVRAVVCAPAGVNAHADDRTEWLTVPA